MSRSKNISKYYQQQKKQQKKRNSLILTVITVTILIALLIGVILLAIFNKSSGVGSNTDNTGITGDDSGLLEETVYGDGKVDTSEAVKVALEIKDYGTITLELYPNEAPITVENFVNYVEEGFYDGLIFHRVIKNFMIQGGDPTGTGYGDSSLEKIKGEFYNNGVDNDLKFERGVIGMARSDDPNSASSQFFIMHKKTESLDGNYAAFGKVIDGMDVVDKIATCKKTEQIDSSGNRYVPATNVVIEKAYIVE